MSNLPRTGLQAVIEGATKFVKDLDTVNKAIDTNANKTKEAAKNASPLDKALGKIGSSFDSLKDKVTQFTGINTKALDGVLELTSAFGPMGVALGAAALGAAALGAAFLALGQRGAPLVGLAEAFDHLTASVGISSQALLVDLRKAANGTVSDFDLIKRANLALVGSTGQFGKEFGQKLPQVLAAARAAAKATGQDVDFLFQSLVSGIKRASPRLIDNTGIVLKLGAANEELAKKLGKTVAQLTDEEKQIATLNATVAAGQDLINSLGAAQETNAEKLARSQATITNIFDSLAVAVQPAFGTVLDIVNRVLGAFQTLTTGLAPILGSIASTITNVLGGVFNTILDIIQPIIDVIGSFLPYIAILFQGIANVVGGVVNVIRSVVGGVVNFLKDVAKRFFGLDLSNLGKNLFEGAAKAFGSFANGIIAVANQLIFPAVIGIAKFIADFLIGFSPPKKGPLSNIDKGGYNVMAAWLDGFTGVSLDPVEQVTAEVNAALGAIGQASLPVVEARLAQLDKTLLPFQNRLDIVKSQFEAIAEPAKAALDAIDRQVQEAQAALAAGDQGAAERIRQLDAAREAIQGQVDAQQALVDRQQIQLALATASQIQERTLLNIRKAALEAAKKKAGVDGAAGRSPADRAAAGGAGAGPVSAPENTGIMGGPTGPSALDLIGGQSGVDEAIAGIQDAFAGQIDTSQLALFQTNQADLQTQLDRIGSVDLGAKLQEKFKGIGDIFDPNVEGSPANVASRFFSPNPETPGSLSGFVNSIGPTLDNLKTDITTKANDFFGSIFDPDVEGSAAGVVKSLFAGTDDPKSIASFFNNLGPNIEAAKPAVEAAIRNIFDSEVDGSPAQILKDAVMTLTGDQDTADSVASLFSKLPENISTAASGLFDTLQTNVFNPVSDFLTGQGADTLSGYIDSAVNFFAEFPTRVVEVLKGLGMSIYTAIVLPIITVINSLIASIEATLKGALISIAGFLGSAADTLSGILDTSGIRNIANDLTSKAQSLSFGRIATEIPVFLQPQAPPAGAARGGLFSSGLLRVGERGPETLFNAGKVGVLPADLTQIIQGIGSIMAQPAPMAVPGNTYNESNSSSYNFYGVQSDNDARRRYNSLRAGMR